MKLIEALKILRNPPSPQADKFGVYLVCGFNPLHLDTLLAAELQLLFPDRRIEVQTGLYGDFWGSLARLEKAAPDVGVLLLEWPDLDPRLGIRSLGGWTPGQFTDILNNARARASQIQEEVDRLSHAVPLVFCPPTLPLPPISFAPGWQASDFDLELHSCVDGISAHVARNPNVRVVNPQRLAAVSPPGARFDAKAEILAGVPYKLPHAAALAEMLGRLVQNPPPKKGLITDLDNTLWDGILGEVGVEGISWDLDHRSQMHGVYQQLLAALSAEGVLIGVASKNDRSLVDKAFQRENLLVAESAVFPIEAHWAPKSESVAQILKAWNIGADAVVFVDDSPMELAEVGAAFPEVVCLRFPGDPDGVYEFLFRLRDLFGKSRVTEEDTIRLESIRRAQSFGEQGRGAGGFPTHFLEQAEAELALNFSKAPLDPRALELVNKTNQFNLNGRRYSEADWKNYFENPDAFLLLVAYKDKYGPLGKIAVMAGRRNSKKIFVDVWVMSCRAFGRRIEHRCLEELFAKTEVPEIAFYFIDTPKNGPLQEFLEEMLGSPPASGCRLSQKQFLEVRPETFHRIQEVMNG